MAVEQFALAACAATMTIQGVDDVPCAARVAHVRCALCWKAHYALATSYFVIVFGYNDTTLLTNDMLTERMLWSDIFL